VLGELAREAIAEVGVPADAVSIVAGGGREELREVATQRETIDLLIPRGGEGLKTALMEYATVPVIYAAAGNCHVYVDASADLEMARAITLNAKVQRPGVCNAVETLLVHADVAPEFLPLVMRDLRDAGVELRGDARSKAAAGSLGDSVADASDDDWATEFHDLVLAVRVVDSVDEAIDHVNTWGTGHSDSIVTDSQSTAQAWTTGVDSACVYVNASTRFTDGGEFGMGAEIGNSTQKLHARGPIGIRELCTYKYVVEGSGQIRA
jgi:glutamate-5-semialdehyde dehydrogenase